MGYIGFMDILSEILNLAGIEKSVLIHHSLYKPWAMRFPCDKSIGFHVVTQGQMHIRSPHLKTPLLMKKGDILLVARGHDHEVATDLKIKAQKTISFQDHFKEVPGQKPLATFASGVYRFRDAPTHALFKEMPTTILLRAEEIPSHDPLHSALQLLSAELSLSQMGSESVTRNLLDILFHYILRNWLNTKNDKGRSWSLAIKDENMMKALKVIHEKPEHSWSVESLAEASGLSRAAFAQKFKQSTGDTPAHYLAKVRMQKAMQYFRTGSYNIEQVAEAVGYQDSFVFSKIFKRLQGISPRDYRKSLAEEIT